MICNKFHNQQKTKKNISIIIKALKIKNP